MKKLAIASAGVTLGAVAYRFISLAKDQVKASQLLWRAEQEMTEHRLFMTTRAVEHLATALAKQTALLLRIKALNLAEAAWVLGMPQDEIEEYLAGVFDQ